MSEVLAAILPFVISAFGGGSLVTLIGYFFLRGKTKSEAARNRAEASGVDVGSQNRIIEGWAGYAADLETRLQRSDDRLDAIERRDQLLSVHVFAQSLWIQKSYLVMTGEQKAQVGVPPEPLDPTLLLVPPVPRAASERPTPPPGGAPNG